MNSPELFDAFDGKHRWKNRWATQFEHCRKPRVQFRPSTSTLPAPKHLSLAPSNNPPKSHPHPRTAPKEDPPLVGRCFGPPPRLGGFEVAARQQQLPHLVGRQAPPAAAGGAVGRAGIGRGAVARARVEATGELVSVTFEKDSLFWGPKKKGWENVLEW